MSLISINIDIAPRTQFPLSNHCVSRIAVTQLNTAPTTPTPSNSWPVAVFARNERANIIRCLDALIAAEPEQPLDIFVIVNGCTDGTDAIVREYSRDNPLVHLVSVKEGDKSNAWNIYAHSVAPTNAVHFFTDGDVEVCRGALSKLRLALLENPDANGAAAAPMAGRSVESMRRQVQENHELMGNLYAIRGSFLERMRRKNIRLPIGFIGEDGLVGALLKWDLNPREGWNPNRVVPCVDACFTFRSVSPFYPRHWRLYWKRLLRYRLRRHQSMLIGPYMKMNGLEYLPRFISDLYGGESDMPRPFAIKSMFDAAMLYFLRKAVGLPPGARDRSWSEFRIE